MASESVTPPMTRERLPLPVPQRSRYSGRKVVVERVVEKSSAAIVYPVLTLTNYSEWSLVMRVNLRVVGLWDIINKGVSDYKVD
jgi:hypothetical protein